MVLVGKIGLILGLIITLVGLVGGFSAMFSNYDQLATLLFMSIPAGFILMFAGLSTVVMFTPREGNK
jgi:FtsH-binding integral membrane protein